jgi:hypothetical protein
VAKAKHTPQEVWDLALSEVYDRISTDPSKIPPTVLSTLLATCQRVMEQQKEELSLAEVEPTDVFASLGSLPPDRAIQLLKSERKRLLDLVLEIDQRMESFHV